MAVSLKLPVGIEDFQEIRRLGFYYVDKTKLIESASRKLGKGESLYQAPALWEDFEYEYAPLLFRDRNRQDAV